MKSAVEIARELMTKTQDKEILSLCKAVIDAEWALLEYSEKRYYSDQWSDEHIQNSAYIWLRNHLG